MRLGSYPEIGWCVRCEQDLREGKKVVNREMQAVEVEYAMFQIAAGVAGERLGVASEELGNVGFVAGPDGLAGSFLLNAEPIPPPTDDTARSALADTPDPPESTGNRPPSRRRPLGRMARRGGGQNTIIRVSRSFRTTQTHRSNRPPSRQRPSGRMARRGGG